LALRHVAHDREHHRFGKVLERVQHDVDRKRGAIRTPAGKVEAGTRRTMFEKFYEQSPDAIIVVDEIGWIDRVNALAEALFGLPRERMGSGMALGSSWIM